MSASCKHPPAEPATEVVPSSAAGPVRARLWSCVSGGFRAGGKTSLWLLRIMIPISLAVKLLGWLGWLKVISKPLEPLFSRIGLPAETVVAFVTGMLINIYSGIAALGSLPLTGRQVTLLALMMLIAHNLPVEATVQHKAGTAMWRSVLLRLAASLLGVWLLNMVLPHPANDVAYAAGSDAGAVAFWPMIAAWAKDTALLTAKVIVIVIGLMILQRALKEFKLIAPMSRALYPLLWLLGLPKRCAFLWIVANTLGLAYGAAVILEEVKDGAIGPRDAQLLNRSVAICHSLLEDTLLFVGIGAWAVWITLPRLALAAAAVWLYRLVAAIVRAYRPLPAKTGVA